MATKLILVCFFIGLFQRSSAGYIKIQNQEAAGATDGTAGTEKQLVMVFLPYNDEYYKPLIKDIADFVKNMSKGTDGNDDFLILYPDSTNLNELRQNFGNFGPNARCLKTGKLGLWARDWGLMFPKKQIKFRYYPDYMTDKYVPNRISAARDDLFYDNQIVVKTSSIILDGGNVVDNGKDKALVTERVVKDNRRKDEPLDAAKKRVKSALEAAMGVKIGLIPDFGDTTGHSDGMVSFVDENTLLIGDYGNEDDFQDMKAIVLKEFPNLKVGKLRCYLDKRKKKWRLMDSAIGAYINSLVTNRAVYVPQFDDPPRDEKAIAEVTKYATQSGKVVVPISTAKLGFMGGNVRCMTWQADAQNSVATKLLANSQWCDE